MFECGLGDGKRMWRMPRTGPAAFKGETIVEVAMGSTSVAPLQVSACRALPSSLLPPPPSSSCLSFPDSIVQKGPH